MLGTDATAGLIDIDVLDQVAPAPAPDNGSADDAGVILPPADDGANGGLIGDINVVNADNGSGPLVDVDAPVTANT